MLSLCRIYTHISIQLILHWQPLQVVFCTALICTYALQYTLLRYALCFRDFTCRIFVGVDFGSRLYVTFGDSSVATKFTVAIWFDMFILFYVFCIFKRSLTSQTSLDLTFDIPSHWKEVYRVDISVNHGDE